MKAQTLKLPFTVQVGATRRFELAPTAKTRRPPTVLAPHHTSPAGTAMASAADNLRRELRAAVQVLRARGLRVAAKWASELLVGRSSERGSTAGDAGLASAAPPSAAEAVLDSDSKEAADPLSADTADALVLATSYFDSHEFRRAAHLLSTAAAADASGAAGAGTSAKSMSPVSMASVLGPRAFFLRCYSLYMVHCWHAPNAPWPGHC